MGDRAKGGRGFRHAYNKAAYEKEAAREAEAAREEGRTVEEAVMTAQSVEDPRALVLRGLTQGIRRGQPVLDGIDLVLRARG